MLLNSQQFQQIAGAIAGLNPAQLAWVSGYLSGLTASTSHVPTSAITIPAVQGVGIKTTVLYGSQTGNARKVAEQLSTKLQVQGSEVSLANIKDFRPQQLKKEQRIIAVVSTQGNGEPPDDARSFYNFILSERAPKLEGVEFAVFGLGDSSYDAFCEAGVQLDKRLAELGATRLLERADADVDFATTANGWHKQVLEKTPSATTTLQPTVLAQQVQQGTEYSAENPFHAELLTRVVLTDTGSEKDVLHLELSLEDSGITYQPGDILAVTLPNRAPIVDAVLDLTKLAGNEKVVINDIELDLRTALTLHRELSSVTRRQLKNYAQAIQHPELLGAAEDKKALGDWLEAVDWADLVSEFPGQLTAQGLVDLLRPLQPRQYSIASSLNAHPDEVHLVVKRVEYNFQGRTYYGLASNGLADIPVGEKLPIYIKRNDHFKLPDNPETKIILIGSGTGVAPFRSFLWEREALGIKGNSWLFFGEQHFRTDFLYQAEWQQLLANGTLERLSVAFSRDQKQKIYVQHRLLEAGETLYQWLEAGAHIYVCGDMNHMAKDVHQALLDIVVKHGGKTTDEANVWLEQLITEHRYQRDVY